MSGDILCNTLIEFLDFLKFKIKEGKFTLEELESFYNVLNSSLNVYATIEDLAKHYGKEEVRVRTEINKKLISKPIRRVYYRYQDFDSIVPKSWKSIK